MSIAVKHKYLFSFSHICSLSFFLFAARSPGEPRVNSGEIRQNTSILSLCLCPYERSVSCSFLDCLSGSSLFPDFSPVFLSVCIPRFCCQYSSLCFSLSAFLSVRLSFRFVYQSIDNTNQHFYVFLSSDWPCLPLSVFLSVTVARYTETSILYPY